MKPTIITGVKPTDDISDQETFGPSASLYVVENEEEAIQLANKSAYGLNASIHTTQYLKGLALARDLDYGQVHINMTTVYDQSTLPIGGVKGSGWGSVSIRIPQKELCIAPAKRFTDIVLLPPRTIANTAFPSSSSIKLSRYMRLTSN